MKTTGVPPNKLMVRLYRMGLGLFAGRMILLLTTTGRKSGLPRVTPLQYEKVNGEIVVACGFGRQSDWVRNLQNDPHALVQIRMRKFRVVAELITDAEAICDFIVLRLKRHPLMVGAILHSKGLLYKPVRSDLLAYSQGLAMAILHRE